MKKHGIRLAAVVCVAALAAACTEEPAPTALVPTVAPQAEVQVFTVAPSGDVTGLTDWQNIKDALEAAKNGGTVKLAAGTFYLHESIVVFDFNGTFKGERKALTTVQTAPGIDFDVSASLDAIEGIPPARGFIASMFLFPFTPGSEAKTFRMSNMKIVVDRPAADPPLDGYVDYRRSFLLNTMHAVVVTNLDVRKVVTGEPFETINLEGLAEHIEVEGTQHSDFHGFWDGWLSDTDNSIFGGISIWGPSVGKAEAKDIHMVNADIGINLSLNSEALYRGSVVENAVIGLETLYSRTIASDNELNNCFWAMYLFDTPNSLIVGNSISGDGSYPIFLEKAPNSLIEANSISGDGRVPIIFSKSPNTDIINNFVTGNWVYGINPWAGSNGCTITGNLLADMNSDYGAISVEVSNDCTVSGNTFVNVSGRRGAVWVGFWATGNTIRHNYYTQSGLPGWHEGTGAILLDRTTRKNNVVAENKFPGETTICEQVLDYGTDNLIPEIEACEHRPVPFPPIQAQEKKLEDILGRVGRRQ